jgi:hypothetical protein
VIGISASTCVPWTGKSGLRYVWSSEKICCCLHAVCSGSRNDCLDSHDSVLSLMSWCNISAYTWRAPNGARNGGLPISMWGRHLSVGRCEQHTTRTTIVLAFWQIYDNAILIMFDTS